MVDGHRNSNARVAFLLDGMDELAGHLRIAPGLFTLVFGTQIGVDAIEGIAQIPAGAHGLGIFGGRQRGNLLVGNGHVGGKLIFLTVHGNRRGDALCCGGVLRSGCLPLRNGVHAARNHGDSSQHGNRTAYGKTAVLPLAGDADTCETHRNQCDRIHRGACAAKDSGTFLNGLVVGCFALRICRYGCGGVVCDLLLGFAGSGPLRDVDGQSLTVLLRDRGCAGLQSAHLPCVAGCGAIRENLLRHGGDTGCLDDGFTTVVGDGQPVFAGGNPFGVDGHRGMLLGGQSGCRHASHHEKHGEHCRDHGQQRTHAPLAAVPSHDLRHNFVPRMQHHYFPFLIGTDRSPPYKRRSTGAFDGRLVHFHRHCCVNVGWMARSS